ncbi:cytochrome-c peroxidase [Methylocystis sp. ATCC 49242]|uniref:cytochrome-c peroxidase n=1 Tax=Methylocystis sp. ATCC 49242 TaxID=622637 RepID=UPI0001F88834|nr:cytochrome-c peroxidase [Methylocystis sp. ATCC 49242]
MSRLRIASTSAMLLFPLMAHAGDLRADATAVFKTVDSVNVSSIVKNNELTPAKAELGKKLFFEPRLSKSQVISCNSCHNLATGGVDAGPLSIGHGWAKGGRRAPTVLNAVFNIAQFWDGRAVDLKAQAKGPVQADVEMNNTPAAVEATLRSMPAYVAEFRAAFPNDANPVSFDNMANAIEAFEATLTTPNAKFDKFLKGDDSAMNEVEKKGLRLFMDKGCAGCHNGVNVGGNSYQPFGVAQKPGPEVISQTDKGRSKITGNAADDFVFRVAPLRNVALHAPYFHSGSAWTLEDAVAIMAKDQLGQTLSADETGAIVAFLGTLTGDQPKVQYPILPARTKDTPRPQ